MNHPLLRPLVMGAIVGCVLFSPAGDALAHYGGLYRIGGETFAIQVGAKFSFFEYASPAEGLLMMQIFAAQVDASSSQLPDFLSPRTRFIQDLHKTLQVEVVSEGTRRALQLQKNEPSDSRSVVFVFIPTTARPYTLRIWGTINAVAVDIQIPCNPAGHVTGVESENRTSRELSSQVTQLFSTGSISCPESRSVFTVPEVDVPEGFSQAILGLKGTAQKTRQEVADLATPVASTRLIAAGGAGLGFIALVLALGALWRTRNKNRLPY